jgi:hypothetical protein
MGLTDWLRDRPIAIRSATALILEHDSTPLSLEQHDWFVALLSLEVEVNRLVQSRFEALSPAGNSPIEYHDLIRHTDHILCYRYLGAPSNAALEDLYTQQSREAKARAEAQAIMAAESMEQLYELPPHPTSLVELNKLCTDAFAIVRKYGREHFQDFPHPGLQC